MYKYIVFLGPPGSGKGTQAKKIAQKLGYFYFGTGDLMREEADNGTEMGKVFEETWKKGELVEDHLVIEFVNNKLKKIKQENIVFDGFPRSSEQVQYFKNHFDLNDVLAVNLEVPVEDLIKRLSIRLVCEKCDRIYKENNVQEKEVCPACNGHLIERDDDKPEILHERINVYREETKPLIDFFHKNGHILDIDGTFSIEEVEKNIWEKINAYK
jgi:adenylate kinase